MNKRVMQLCSLVLSAIMLFNLLPLHVLASEVQKNSTSGETVAESEPVYIVEEIVENRTEYGKEYLLSNGLYIASTYTSAVHYKKDGQWEEIDNTLQLDADNKYRNAAGEWQVSFPRSFSGGTAVSIAKDGYELSFYLAGELRTLETDSQSNTYSLGGRNETSYTIADARSSRAVVEEIDLSAQKEAAQFEETVLDKLTSRLRYDDIYENTDIIYDLGAGKLKESIVIRQYNPDLQGYRYIVDMESLVPIVNEDNEIELYDSTGNTLVMVMPAPFLVDNAGNYNYDIQVNLTENEDSYDLSYILPQDWLSNEARQWPVTLDPVIESIASNSNAEDQIVYENTSLSSPHTSNSLNVGYETVSKTMRTYMRYHTLPALTSSDVIISASIELFCGEKHGTTTTIEVREVLEDWDASTITWDSQPSYSDIVEDFAICSSAQTFYNWDITDLVRSWYAGSNFGMVFKTTNTQEQERINSWLRYYSADFQSDCKPTLTIIFRNNNGLEAYWDYTTSSAGRAGTGYVNNYTGNLVWVHNDIGFAGNLMPVTISHIYNANDSLNDDFGMGYGWRTNFNQLVYHSELDEALGDYYVWEDADGTLHYFLYESAGIYKDEDGLELTLTTNGSDTSTYCITDKYGNKSFFDSYGRLSEQRNNQDTYSSITIEYTSNSGCFIKTISDGAGRKYSFEYAYSHLKKISYTGSSGTTVSYVTFTYNNTQSNPQLLAITDQDGGAARFTYNSENSENPNLLNSAQDIDGYKLTYTYNTLGKGQPNRIASITETDGSVTGRKLTVSYAKNQTTFTDQSGNVQIMQFNNFGNTVSIQDNEGRAQYAKYAINDPPMPDEAATAAEGYTNPKNNQLRLTSRMQNTVGNILDDSSFENGTNWFTLSDLITGSVTDTQAYSGRKSLMMVRDADGVFTGLRSAVFSIPAGATYVFSAYVKTTGGSSCLVLTGGSKVECSEYLPANTDWTRLEVSYTNETSSAVEMSARIETYEAGTTYVDCAQVENAETPSRYNLIQNGDFRYTTCWSSSSGRTVLSETAAPSLSTNTYKMTGSPTATNRISQTVQVSGNAGDTFVLAGWAKGESAPLEAYDTNPREFGIIATFKYTDGTTSTDTVHFNDCVENWQYVAKDIEAEKAYSSVVIQLAYDYNVNTVYFDGIQLFKEEFGTQYEYDLNGNIISATDIQNQETTYAYDANNNIKTITEHIGNQTIVTSYLYDQWHNVTKATTSTGVIYTFTYDKYGNNTSVSIGSGDAKITSSTAYTDNGNLVDYVVDAAGQKTDYTYDSDTGLLESVKYPNDDSNNTTYSYDSMFRLASAATTTDQGSALTASYTYENDLLKKITTASTTYTFTYGDFALLQNVNVGSQVLASYGYADRTHYLENLAFGNGDVVKYTYDQQGRITQEAYYEDGSTAADSTVVYKYDNSGYPASVTDSETGITTKYYYDLIDRMMKYVESGADYSHSVEYGYDARNNLSVLTEYVDDTKYTAEYTYDSDNRVTSVSVKVNDTATSGESYEYDAYGRIANRTTSRGSTSVMTEVIGYVGSGNTTSGQIASITVKNPSGTTELLKYEYTYDGNGNITKVTSGGKTTSYVYDTANQLIRENNEAADKTWVWEYDNAGNIVSRSEYDYTEEADPGTADSIVEYDYTNELWGDLLTVYGDLTIEYDGVGNPITVMDSQDNIIRSYTWTRGRQLESTVYVEENKEITVSYTYNADGLRIGKTVTTKVYESSESTTHTVTFVADGVTVGAITVEDGCVLTDADYPAVPAKSGYTGTWNKYTGAITSDITIQAVYTATETETNTHTVTFKVSYGSSSYGTTLKTMTVEDGYVLTDDDYPTSSYGNYTIVWEKYTSPITSDITVNGTYSTSSAPTTYTVTFVADGTTVDTLTVNSGYTLTDSDYPEVPAKSGYTGAWEKYTSPIYANITIEAVYTEEGSGSETGTHTVTFQVAYTGSTYGTTVKTMTVEDGYVLTDDDYPTSSSSYYSYTWEQYTSPITEDITITGTYSWGASSSSEEGVATMSLESDSTTLVSTTVEEHRYVYNGGSLTQEVITTTVDGGTATTETLFYAYDASGTPMSVTYNDTTYYYVTNLQGDVTAILNSSRTAVVTYTYDAWGNILTADGTMENTLGEANSLCYRGYVYDSETGLYYLQSRYYDPSMGRFINADAFVSTGQGLLGNNMFSYCCNNPANKMDPLGYRSISNTNQIKAVCFESTGQRGTSLNQLQSEAGNFSPEIEAMYSTAIEIYNHDAVQGLASTSKIVRGAIKIKKGIIGIVLPEATISKVYGIVQFTHGIIMVSQGIIEVIDTLSTTD